MSSKRALKELFHSWVALQGGIALYPKGINEFLFTAGFPRHYEELEASRKALDKLGLYEILLNALTRAETLAKDGNYDDAEMVVLEAGRLLGAASGAHDDLRRLYTAANDPKKT
ncbi:hypothetical protein [Rhizobacter sp. Root1221]|uniref:hypothetical protein n=1 Tax=Rhizobacter sp. Root1221 TaxID=1736433 RepID=UPI0006F36A56|nr:hypothetical protein [Rhizobacter sp. Root1221]KQW00446.1 hypothetical protein ASC87_18010 [Rhizobacter sp. Root1221]